MKKVLAFGTFDIFHKGHEYYLKKAKSYGGILQVVVARDSTVKKIKGRAPLNWGLERLKHIKSLDYVNEAFLGYEKDKFRIIEESKPNVICLGYDQVSFTKNLKNILRERGLEVEIVELKSFKPELYKSSIKIIK